MFESLQPMPADAILGLIVEHRNDARPEKIDLGVGVYRDANGQTPVPDTVKVAEKAAARNSNYQELHRHGR